MAIALQSASNHDTVSAILKRQAELDKLHRRVVREHERKQKQPREHAQCGIRWYSRSPRDIERGNYWKHCHACGQFLIYTADPNAKPQQCRSSSKATPPSTSAP